MENTLDSTDVARIPSLMLYGLRWQLVRGHGSCQRAAVLWSLGAMHELLGVALFLSAGMDEFNAYGAYLTYGYMAGVGISLANCLNASNPGQYAAQ